MELNLANAKDIRAGRLTATYTDLDSRVTGARDVDQVVLVAGAMMSHGIGVGPMRAFGPGAYDESAPSCALQLTGPGGQKLRTRVCLKYQSGSGLGSNSAVPLMNGWLTKHSHQLGWGDDSVIHTYLDDLWLLGKVTCGARATFDPKRNRYYWEFAKKPDLTFNAMGYPDCLDTDYGPMFAPTHRFGFRNDFKNWSPEDAFEDNDEPAPGKARTIARSWRGEDAIKYLRNVHTKAGGASRPPFQVDIGNILIPDFIEWPEGLGSLFGSNRTLKGMPCFNNSLLDVLQAICRKMGAYDLACEARGQNKSVLTIYNMNPAPNTGITLFLPSYASADVGQAMNSTSIVKSLQIDEDAGGTFDDVTIIGNPPSVEDMFSTYSFGTGASTLEPAWSEADENAFKVYISRYGDTLEAYQAACDKWPMVYCAYKIRDDANTWNGTKWEGKKNEGPIKIKPFLNTGYNQDGSNPANWQPREIVVEYLYRYDDEYDSGAPPDPAEEWRAAQRYDNLTLTADSAVIYLDALRQQRQTWVSRNTSTGTNGTYVGSKMRKRNIRLTCAIDGNWPLTGSAGSGAGKEDDPNLVYDRFNKPTKDIRFTWIAFAEDGDYVELLRKSSARPCGEANFTKISDFRSYLAFPAKCTEGNELFTDRKNATTGRLPDHARARLADVKRVSVEGTYEIESVAFGIRPGLTVSIEGGNTIKAEAVCKAVVFRSRPRSPREGQTSVIVGPPERQTIYDIPGGGRAIASDSSYQPSGSGGGDPYDIYDNGKNNGGTGKGGGNGEMATDMSGGRSPSDIQSDNDTEKNNQAIRNNKTAERNMGTTGTKADSAAASVQRSQEAGSTGATKTRTENRAANAKAMAEDARAAGDMKAAEKHEKAARRLDKKSANEEERRAAQNAFPTTSVNGRVVNIEKAFGESLVGGGFTMPGGSRQVRAGDLGRGGDRVTTSINGQTMDMGKMSGSMLNTSQSDAADKSNYTARKTAENATASASIDRFSGTTRKANGQQLTNVERNSQAKGTNANPVAPPASVQPQRAQAALKEELGMGGSGGNQYMKNNTGPAGTNAFLGATAKPKTPRQTQPEDE